MSTTQQPEALAADHSEQTLEMVARWYMIDKDGMATLCTDREDAEQEAKDANMAWPHTAPHRAVQLVEVADVEALRTGYAAARLEIESLQARIKTMAEEHADELMVAHLDGRSQAAQQPAPSAAVHVGDSLFESWFSEYNPAHRGTKQQMRDAYAAGMGDPKAQPSPTPQADSQPAPTSLEQKYADYVETVGKMLEAVGYTEAYALQWPKEKASVTFKRWFDEQISAARATADSVTAPACGVAAHTISDAQIEAMPVWRNFVGLWPESRREIVDAVVDLFATPPAQAADSVLEDAARLDWLLLHISGAEFRRIGVHYSGNAGRADVDAARKKGANHD